MNFKSGQETLNALSYFQADRLEVIFLKTSAGGGLEAQDKLWIPFSESLSEKDAAAMQRQIAEKFSGHGNWIHIVMRQGGFVKTFAVPDLPEEKLNPALVQRVSDEMPHLAHDILYHIAIQNGEAVEKREALLFGISKAALEDQLAKLSQLGVIPDSVMLSTEVLYNYYQNSPAGSSAANAMLVHEAGRQLELIFINQGRLVQSRWFKKEAYEQDGFETLVRAAGDSLQREGRAIPAKAVLMGGDLKTAFFNGVMPYEFLDPAGEAQTDPLLWKAALKAYKNSSVFDFTPAAWESRRRKLKAGREGSSLLTWLAVFAAAFFFFALTKVVASGLQNIQLAAQHAPVASAVKDLKALQSQALSANAYQQRKIFPLLLLEKLRAAVPLGVLLEKLEYDQKAAAFSMRGESTAEPLIHEFLEGLQKQPLFSGLKLERVEAHQDESGRIYEFEMKGFLGKRGIS